MAIYVVGSTLARIADGGQVLAVVLLVTMSGGNAKVAGALAASVTAPHLFGPFVAKQIDVARDPRRLIASACVLYAVLFAMAVTTFGMIHIAATALILAASGLCGPLLTGGISTRLSSITGSNLVAQRRAHGWDVATYGLGGTLGPSLVAAVAGGLSPAAGAMTLAIAAGLAAPLVMALPQANPRNTTTHTNHAGSLRVLIYMVRTGRLRRTLYLTMCVAFGLAALPVVAVYLTPILGVPPARAGVLTAAYGLGGLAGSLVMTIRPNQRSPDISMSVLTLVVAMSIVGVMGSTSFAMTTVAYLIVGIANAYFFAATLAARADYAPHWARGQTFLWVAALKIAFGAAGTAVAGAIVLRATSAPLLAAAVVILVAAAFSIADRSVQNVRHPSRS